jgi:chemotaxis protein CheZ
MADVQQKRFRIEEMLPRKGFACEAQMPSSDPSHAELVAEVTRLRTAAVTRAERTNPETRALKQELDLMYEAISRTKREIASLHASEAGQARVARASLELDAVIGSTESATQSILHAAEEIDEMAKTLAASVKNEQEQALAQDIQDHVVRIYEACNFQDLAGQRIGKATTTLKFIEQHILRMMDIWGGLDSYAAAATADERSRLLNGPRLEGDADHASQQDIDRMFN